MSFKQQEEESPLQQQTGAFTYLEGAHWHPGKKRKPDPDSEPETEPELPVF